MSQFIFIINIKNYIGKDQGCGLVSIYGNFISLQPSKDPVYLVN